MTGLGGFIVLRGIVLSFLTLFPSAIDLRADEGMWTFDNLPLKQMQARYGFTPAPAWLDHLRLSTVIFGEEGTGSLVGRDGLILTNHHVAHACIQQVSNPDRDLVKQGFVARSRDQEIRIPGLEIQILQSVQEVTQEVEQAVKPGMSSLEADSARLGALEEIKRRENGQSGLSCDLVDFYEGGEYWIYRYRKFGDVRLVMAPEYDIAAFGKEWDNFAYPRHDLDFSLFRVYENGQPCHPEHALTWTRTGITNGAMTLVAGHPGRTNRLETCAQMDFRRRVVNPLIVLTLERNLKTLTAYASRNEECARQVSANLLEASNFLKVYREEIRGLEDPKALERLQSTEKDFRARLGHLPQWKDLAGRGWNTLEHVLKQQEALAKEYQLLHRNYCSLERGPLYRALKLVRLLTESAKPARQRWAGYSDAEIGVLRSELLATIPLNRELETLLLAAGLEETRDWLGDNHALTRTMLGGKSPKEVAGSAIAGTRIDDPAFVQDLIESGPEALVHCQDPLILLASRLDPHSREVKRQYDTLETQVFEHNVRIAQARRAVFGKAAYPEATFTLRLSYGAVQSYEAEGTLQPPFTTFGGLFDRADAWGPAAEHGSWSLPPRWTERRRTLNPSIPLDFVTTNDIIGGSSGSPVVDRNGELVGLVFDGNIQSIPGRFYYDEKVNRCIAVDARAIIEALAKVYDADHLVKELTER
jgi:hypothetical protein